MNPYFSEDEDALDDTLEFIWQEPRKEPLGAPKESLCDETLTGLHASATSLHAPEEHEILSSSVISLTSHLAQVEFRLRQILKAPPEKRDTMLRALEEFTSGGALNARATPQGSTDSAICNECVLLEKKISHQRSQQCDLVVSLKKQLLELESYINTAGGNACLESNKNRALIEHLKEEINKGLVDTCHQPLTADELRHQINCVVKQYVNKQLSADDIIKLQAHIDAMQKFITVMKNEDVKEYRKQNVCDGSQVQNKSRPISNDDLKTETIKLVRKATNLIQIFTVSQFGCSPNTQVKKYEMKSPVNVSHWGNLRAKLEISVDMVYGIVSKAKSPQSLFDSCESDGEEIILSEAPLTRAVRQKLATNLRDLLHHGLINPESNSLVPFIGCFPVRKSFSGRSVHIWDIILRYYDINDGDAFNSTPARKLSQSFNLNIVGGIVVSNKQSLLSSISTIIASHSPYKRSKDAQFKAFVCAGLNAHKLVVWLNMVLKCRFIIDTYYSSISYVVNTGFQDALQSLDRLTPYNFDLPVDLAVKQFQNIKDVFM